MGPARRGDRPARLAGHRPPRGPRRERGQGQPAGVRLALEELAAGDADLVAVAKLDRIARSLSHAAELLEAGRRQGWALVCFAPSIDTSTRYGRMPAGLMAVLAAWERDLIADRTREALDARRARGERLGRRSALTPELAAASSKPSRPAPASAASPANSRLTASPPSAAAPSGGRAPSGRCSAPSPSNANAPPRASEFLIAVGAAGVCHL